MQQITTQLDKTTGSNETNDQALSKTLRLRIYQLFLLCLPKEKNVNKKVLFSLGHYCYLLQ